MHKLIFTTGLIFLLNACGGGTGKTPIIYTPHANDTPAVLASTKQAYLDAINHERSAPQNCGIKGIKPAVSPLVWNDNLYKAAYEHSEDLAVSNTFSHSGSGTNSDWTAQVQNLGEGSTFKERSENNGYIGWKTLGENIAKGQTSITQVIKSWMDSDGHCANMMSAKYTEIGMAQFEKDGSIYWTQNFGAR